MIVEQGNMRKNGLLQVTSLTTIETTMSTLLVQATVSISSVKNDHLRKWMNFQKFFWSFHKNHPFRHQFHNRIFSSDRACMSGANNDSRGEWLNGKRCRSVGWEWSHSCLCRSTNAQMHKYTNTQMHKYTNTQIHKYTNTQILRIPWHEGNGVTPVYADPQIHKYTHTADPLQLGVNDISGKIIKSR